MEILLALLFGVLFATSVYLILARSLVRIIIGLLFLGNAANIAIITGGRVLGTTPPLVEIGADVVAETASNPLPQALVLTAIVIAFGLTAFIMVLTWASWRAQGTLDAEAMRMAEPLALPSTDPVAAAAAEPPPEPRPQALPQPGAA